MTKFRNLFVHYKGDFASRFARFTYITADYNISVNISYSTIIINVNYYNLLNAVFVLYTRRLENVIGIEYYFQTIKVRRTILYRYNYLK